MMTFKLWSTLMLCVCGMMLTSSCSSDSDNGGGGTANLDAPKYEKESALYEVTSSSTGLKSIELTASGNYIVDQSGATKGISLIDEQNSFIPKPFAATRASSNGIYYGKFTKVSDTEFILEGFGRIVIGGTKDNATTLTVILENGKEDTVTATKHSTYASSSKTNMLCRTWNMGKVHLYVNYEGQTVDKTFNSYLEYLKYTEGEKHAEKQIYPTQVIFTKSGTYVVIYSNEQLAVSTWKWSNEEKGEARYSWNYKNIDDPQASGAINIHFESGQLVIREFADKTESENAEGYIDWYLTEVK